jgi:hypothetical protein
MVLIFLLLLAAGCSRSPVSSSNAPTPASARWNWQSAPMVERMRLGILPCRVMPKSSQTQMSPLTGTLRVYVDRQQTNVPAGFVWARFEPKVFEAQSNALREAKRKLDEKERLTMSLELPRQMLKDQKDIADAQKQLTMVELLRTNQNVAPEVARIIPLPDQVFAPETLKRLQDELRLLKEHYGLLRETNLLALGGSDPQMGRLEWEQRQLEFERQQNQATLKVPTACQLNVSIQLAEKVTEYPVNTGQELGVYRDLSSILIRTTLSDPAWSTLPTENLSAVITLPTGARLEAPFAFQRLEKVQLREDSVFYFQFPTNRADAAMRLMGSDLSCELWLKLPEKARVIPKLQLVMNHSSLFQSRRWNEGVAQLAPGARVLVEGQTDLAIAVPNKARKQDEGEQQP